MPFEVEGFMAWVLEIEPDKIQLYYCLGLVNLKWKGDLVSVADHWTTFVRLAEAGGHFPEQVEEVKAELAKLE